MNRFIKKSFWKLLKSFLIYFSSIVFVAGLWFVTAKIVDSSIVFPGIRETFDSFRNSLNEPSFYKNFRSTFGRVLLSFCISVFTGTLLGIFSGRFSAFRKFISFPIAVIRSTPVVSLILVTVFLFDSSFIPVFSAVLMALPVFTDSVRKSFNEKTKKLEAMAQVYGFSAFQKFKYIFLPQLRPFFEAGCLSAFGMSWKVVAAGEVLSVPRYGLGTVLSTAQVHLETSVVMATTFFLITAGFFSELMLGLLFKIRLPNRKCRFVTENTSKKDFIQKKAVSSPDFTPANDGAPSGAPNSIFIRNLNFSRGGKKLFENFSFAFEKEKITAIIAPSGSGKTTFLEICAGLLPFEKKDKNGNSGEISFFQSDSNPGKQKISYVFQENRLLENRTVFENVLIPLEKKENSKNSKNNLRLRAFHSILDCGLAEKLNVPVRFLSGGEKQRVSLARAFAFGGDILLLDEPFSSLDFHIKRNLILLLKKMLKKQKFTVLFVTHDIREALEISDRIVVMTSSPLEIKFDEKINTENSDAYSMEKKILSCLLQK